jgi:hypothetical protein
MNPEKLALLTTHGIQIGKPFGGTPALTQMDVAGMMSRCEPCEVAILRAMYCQELIEFYRGRDFFYAHCKRQGWGDYVKTRTIAETTYQEHVLSPRCKACNGTKGLVINSQWVNCERCDGKGYSALGDRALGRLMGMSRLQEPWVGRVAWARSQLNKWEVEALQKCT